MSAQDVSVAFVAAVVAVLMAWAGLLEWRSARRKAARRWTAELQATASHPARRQWRVPVPGLPVDGEPLTEDELYQFTAIMLRPVREPETGSDPRQDERETR